jgi:predicted RNA binding protein YcfA (HicA-like mRNA interferase family)
LTYGIEYGTIQAIGVMMLPGVEKIIEKMKAQPHSIRFSEVEHVLTEYGYAFERQKGSHRRYGNGKTHITIPRQNPLKAAYIAEILKIIEGETEI